MLYTLLVGSAARLLLAWSGIGQLLAWRVEVSTAANSPLELREGLALYQFGVSPYTGSSCRTPPLALWLYGALADHPLLYVLPNIIFDALAALLLHSLATTLFLSALDACSAQASNPYSHAAHSAITSSSTLPAFLARAYLLNPFTLMASAAGTTSSLEGLAVVVALYGGCARRPALATLGLAVATYMSLHTAVLLFPVACLLSYGPEDVAVPLHQLRPAVAFSGSSPGASHTAGVPTPGKPLEGDHHSHALSQRDSVRHLQHKEEGEGVGDDQQRHDADQRQRGDEKPGDQAEEAERRQPWGEGETVAAAAPTAASAAVASPPAAPLLPWRSLTRCCSWLSLWMLLLALASDLYLAPLSYMQPLAGPAVYGAGEAVPTGSHGCLSTFAERLLVTQPWQPTVSTLLAQLRNPAPQASAASASPEGVASPSLPARLAAVGGGLAAEVRRRVAAAAEPLGSCWAARVYGSQVLLYDVTPNVGQWWYLAMEAFDDAKVYIRLLAHSLLFAMAPPLAMRLGVRRPLALFLILLLALGLLKPYPSVADLGLSASMLPLLAHQQLAAMRLRLLLPASLALLCVLGPAMLRMWLSYESANSNFFYSVTLLYGVWQVVLLGQVLGLTLRVDRTARGKGGCAEGG